LGIPIYGAVKNINKEVYERLRSEGEILENLEPLTLRDKYLKDRNYVETKSILNSFFNTPGEIRITSEDVLKKCIQKGVEKGIFGLGDIEDGKVMCRHFKDKASPSLVEGEIIIKAELCKALVEKPEEVEEEKGVIVEPELPGPVKPPIEVPSTAYSAINLKLDVPPGKFSDIARIINYLKTKFEHVETKVEIICQNGKITVSEYEDKVKEALDQANITIREKKLKEASK